MPEDDSNTGGGRLRRGLRSTVGRESTTFGFSILVTVTFGMVQAVQGSPDAPRIVLFAVGAVMSFTLLEGIMSRGFRRPMPQHHTHVLAVGTSLNIVSVTSGLATAWAVAMWLSGQAAWVVAPFLAAVAYLVMEGLWTALAERVVAARGDRSAEELSP